MTETKFLEIYNNNENRPHTRNFIDNIIIHVGPGYGLNNDIIINSIASYFIAFRCACRAQFISNFVEWRRQ